MKAIALSWWHDFVGVFIPELCWACDEALVHGERHICTGCRSKLPYANCHVDDERQQAALRRFWGKLPVQHALVYVWFVRKGRVQQLLHKLKYKNEPEIGVVLGKLFGSELAEAGYTNQFDVIIPVPLHANKQRLRGYNQSERFGEGLSQPLQVRCSSDILVRVTETATQTRKNRWQRWENVSEVFLVQKPELIKGKRVLLVDDVVTTGSTLEACAQKLLDAGCAEVSIAAIAAA